MRRIRYSGTAVIDVPRAGIMDWKPGEVREVSESAAESLLARADEFAPAEAPPNDIPAAPPDD